MRVAALRVLSLFLSLSLSCFLSFPLFLLAGPSRSAVRWERLSLSGGRITVLAVAPSDTSVVYSGGAAVYRSSDAGAHWTRAADPFPSFGPDAPEPSVRVLSVCPTDANRVLAASPQGLFLTKDGGLTWARAGGIATGILSVAFAADGQSAYASGADTLFRTQDGGDTWQAAASSAMAALCTDPLAPSGLLGARLVPDADGRTLCRTDGGGTWEMIPTPAMKVAALATSPAGDAIYAAVPGAGGGLFRIARDGAATSISTTPAVAVSIVPGKTGWLSFLADPASSTTPVIRTIDDGAHWQELWKGYSTRGALALANAHGNALLLGTRSGVLSCDAYDTWQLSNAGLDMAGVASASPSASDARIILARTGDGLYRSADGGATWNSVRASAKVPVMAVSAAKPGRVFHMGVDGLERSEDNGSTWTNFRSGLPAALDVLRLVLHPTLRDTLYAVTSDGAIYRNTTSAPTWARVMAAWPNPPASQAGCAPGFAPAPAPDLALCPAAPSTLYAVRPDGLYRTQNGGMNWSLRSPEIAGTALVAVDPQDPDVLFAAASAGDSVTVSRSADGGATWTRLATEAGLAGGGFMATFLDVDPRKPSRVLLGTNRGLRESDDSGLAWSIVAGAAAFCTGWSPLGESDDLLSTGAGLFHGTPSTEQPSSYSLADAVAILRLAGSAAEPTPEHLQASDVDRDGHITRTDAILALRSILE